MDDSIVVGTDGSDTANLALAEAVRLAKALGGEVHVVSAFEPLRGAHVTGAPAGAAEALATEARRPGRGHPQSGRGSRATR